MFTGLVGYSCHKTTMALQSTEGKTDLTTSPGRFFWRLPQRTIASRDRTLISDLEMRQPLVRLLYMILLGILLILSLSTLFPLYWMFMGAIKSSPELLQTPPTYWPEQMHWENYVTAWNGLRYALYFFNTLMITLGGWLIQIMVSVLAAFTLSKLRPPFGQTVLFLFLCTMMIPSVVYTIPQYLNIINLHLIDSWWGLWLPSAFNAFNIFLLKNFFDEIPQELTDVARLDGAGPLRILWHVILPMSRPAIAVITIFTVINTWKDFFWPFLVLSRQEAWPIGVALYNVTNRLPLNIQIAGLAIASIPPILFFILFQKQILKGISLSGFMNG